MSFKTAERVARLLRIPVVVLLVAFVMLQDSKPALAWCGAAGVILCSIVIGVINFKYMRCPHCGHVVPAMRRVKERCPSCLATLEYDLNGDVIATPPPKKKK